MIWVVGVVSLFFVLFSLLVFYFAYFWDWGWCDSGGVRSWASSFECGFLAQRFVVNYFSCSLFLLLVFFVVFDLEVSLILNIPFEGVLYKNLLGYLVFVGCLVGGYLSEVEGGYVSWDF